MAFIITLTFVLVSLLGWLYFMLTHPDFTIEIGPDKKFRITGYRNKNKSD